MTKIKEINMKNIGIHDSSIGTGNIGDYIILDSAEREISNFIHLLVD